MGAAFTPHWPTAEACTLVFAPMGDKTKAGIRIKRVPSEHRALRVFCETIGSQLGLKPPYCGESGGLLCHELIQQLLVRRRETLSEEDAQRLLKLQEGRCDQCGDIMKVL